MLPVGRGEKGEEGKGRTEMEEQVRKGGKRRTKREEEEDRGEEGRSRVSAENRELGATVT